MQRFVALVLSILTAPLLLVLAVITAVGMGTPVLFRQQRSGLGGRPFTMVKFRSMTDAVGADGKLLPDSERVTAWGRFLRRSRLDELPGLWSIARGDMAFVGPRPLLPETVSSLGERGRERGEVLPGLTGWAQVNGNALLELDDKIALDLFYVRQANWRLDLAILMRTFLVMVLGERLTEAGARPHSR
ncbi:sugar transferase [Qipengyuania sp. 6B39]|uniref:sugar transferase n=1 Tax=Qipengyuania proteolytica TaxID=2867239 RepID=UPI001C8AB7A7|nr:sugar transferase [Qipengyuania proteolytica]MBX7495808.1 sugar transferase [Qipengyuania proteolytica]